MTFSYKFGSALSVLYAAFRVSTANLSPITDCDEVYNYWEPLHFVLYGTGMQTWEYAPQYALRTYAYLLPMAAAAKCLERLLGWLPPPLAERLASTLLVSLSMPPSSSSSIVQDKPLLFAALRSLLALLSCHTELSFLSAVHDVLDPALAHWTASCALAAAGNFHAGQAFLPSSAAMALWRLSAANQLRGRHGRAVFWGLLAVLAVGWPFCAVLFVPTGIWALWKASGLAEGGRGGGGGTTVATKGKGCGRRTFRHDAVMRVLARTALHAVLIQALVMAVDYRFYGRWVSPIWNIFAYNARSGGDELYGVEPLSYYVKNLLLNFNLVALLGIISLPAILLRKMLCVADRDGKSNNDDNSNNNKNDSLEILVLAPMYIWMAIVLPRPHKEERFLFPIYPMLCFGAAVTTRETLRLCDGAISALRRSRERPRRPRSVNVALGLALLAPFGLISISRSFALHRHYTAPLEAYRELFRRASSPAASSAGDGVEYVCTAGEWHRFPSSFFLPPNHRLGFLKSSFGGQLPQPFTPIGSKGEAVAGFNDANWEVTDRYVDIERCSYVVELVPSESDDDGGGDFPECVRYMKSDTSSGSWTLLASYDYLDADATSSLHRILYIPFGRDGKVSFKGYNLYAKDTLA